ncbi:MAG: hypothetical protein ACYSWP_01135 [Planctomycetota bacterium]|jgi:hypothetical protein
MIRNWQNHLMCVTDRMTVQGDLRALMLVTPTLRKCDDFVIETMEDTP